MTFGTELKFTRERAVLSPEMADALDSFAPERDVTAPPARQATHVRLERDPFITHSALVPLAPRRAARWRARLALTILALFGTAAWVAYEYESGRPVGLDIIAAWASRSVGPTDTATAPASAPSEARLNDPTPADSLLASKDSAVSPEPDRTADKSSNPSDATVSQTARPSAARPERTGTSGSLIKPVQNVSGEWRLDTQAETTDASFEDLPLRYEMKLSQDGGRVAGIGTKVSENAQTPVTVTGTIAGDRLTLNVVERGTQPETRSKFVLLVDEAGTSRGRFSSSAAPSSGHVEAHRASSAQ